MTAIQPDLFGEHDARQARVELRRQPVTCPSCGRGERNAILFENSHGYRVLDDGSLGGIGGFPIKDHPIYGALCLAQVLVRNHIHYDVRTGDPRLVRDMARGRELGLDVDAIVAEAEPLEWETSVGVSPEQAHAAALTIAEVASRMLGLREVGQ